MKLLQNILAGIAVLMFVLTSAIGVKAQVPYTLQPWIYDPQNTEGVVSRVQDNLLKLEKNVPTNTDASAGALVYGVNGLLTDSLKLSFDWSGYCGNGAPRFNVSLKGADTPLMLGCTYGDADIDGTVTFVAGQKYGEVDFPESKTVQSIDVVFDEQSQTQLSNIKINGQEVQLTEGKKTAVIECKDSGWKKFVSKSFNNERECTRYFR